MKVVTRTTRALLSMSMMAAVLLLSQQAMAQGTDAGVVVSNQASVDYDVNGLDQTDILSTDAGSPPGTGDATTFVVDRRVDFTIVEIGGAHTEVQPGDVDAFAEFQLTNNGNAVMDFSLSLVDLTSADPQVHGQTDTDDVMSNFDIRVANGDGAAGVPVAGDLTFVDELGEGETVVIYVFADAGATLPNDAYDNFTLNATAADDANVAATVGTLDALLTESAGPDNPAVIESVFANVSGADGSGNATEGADDGFHVNSAQLVITKSAAVISDPFGSGKAVPDAVIEYTVTLDNTTGAAAADNVIMTDQIQTPDVALELAGYGGAGQDVAIDGTPCSAAADADACTYVGGTGVLTVTIPSIAAGASSTVTYRVRISPL